MLELPIFSPSSFQRFPMIVSLTFCLFQVACSAEQPGSQIPLLGRPSARADVLFVSRDYMGITQGTTAVVD